MIKKSCRVCGRIMYTSPSKARTKVFCSNKCYGIAKSRKNPRQEVVCQVCKKPFWVIPYRIKIGRGKFCSPSCYGKWLSDSQRGDKSFLWKGGITPVKRMIRKSLQYQEWRQLIFIRDGFTCQKCGKVGGFLHTHHIKKFVTLLTEAKFNLPLLPLSESALIYAPLWNIDNGITLCEKCHHKRHKGKICHAR